MTGKLKALGLALFVALAVGAVAAQVGSAGGEEHVFTTTGSSDETVLTGEQKTEGISHHEYTEREEAIAQSEATIEKEEEAIEKAETEIANFHEEVETPTVISLIFNKIECTTVTYAGSFVEEEIVEFSVAPAFSDCQLLPGPYQTEIASNGCTFRFRGETTENGAEEVVDAPVALDCSESGEFVIEVNNCTIHLPPQGELHGVSYENLAEDGPEKRDAVKVTATVGGITAISTGGIGCLVIGLGESEKEHNNFGFEGEIVLTGYEGEQEGHKTPIEGDQVDFAVE